MRILYVYDSEIEDAYRSEIKRLLDKVRRLGVRVDEVDTAGWSDEEKFKFYNKQLMPISVIKGRRLRGRIRTHRTGSIIFRDMIIIDDSEFFIGEEAVRRLKAFCLNLKNR